MKNKMKRIGLAVAFAAFMAGSSLPAFAMEKEGGEGSRISWHGYGELHYNNPSGGGFPEETKSATLDFHRLVWGLSYPFSDTWSLHTEIDFEHAATALELEFAYLEYQSNQPVGFRIGSILMPVGPLNEYHEPPLFYSVERPYVQKVIIPTTWNAGGFGIIGKTEGGLKYRLYLVDGLDASKFSDKDGIRKGRQVLTGDNNADKFGSVGRIDYTGIPGLAIGASYYNADAVGANNVSVSLWDVDLRYRMKGFDLSLLVAQSKIDNAVALKSKKVGEEQEGQYGEIAYHLNQLQNRIPDIVPFVRMEWFNTHEAVPAGVTVDPTLEQKVLTYGLAYYPDPNIALKVDREQWRNEADKKADRTNIGVAYMF